MRVLLALLMLSPAASLLLQKVVKDESKIGKFAYVTMWVKKDLVPKAGSADMTDEEEAAEERKFLESHPDEKRNHEAQLNAIESEEELDGGLPKGGAKAYGPSFIIDMDNHLRAAGSVYPLLVVTNDPEMINAPELKAHPMVKIMEMGPDKSVNFVKKGARLQGRNKVHWHKLSIFSFTDYDKLIYMDMDTKVNKNIDHIFTDEKFSTRDGKQVWGLINDFSCKDRRRSDYFNSAVMLIEPKQGLVDDIVNFSAGDTYWGDQAVIQAYFSRKGRKARIFPTEMADVPYCHGKKAGGNHLEVQHAR